MITLKKRTKEFEVVRFLFGLFHLNQILDKKELLTAQALEENAQRKLTMDVSMRNFEDEEIDLERKSKDEVKEFKMLMCMNRLFPHSHSNNIQST